MAYTITSANSIFMLSVGTIFPVPQQLQQFAVDDAFTTELVDATESQVGVDGFGVSGYVPRSPMMTIRLLGSANAAFTIFETWLAAMDALNDVYYCSALISQPSVGRKYTCVQGSLARTSSLGDARKVISPRDFHILWLPQGPNAPAISAAPL